MVATTGMPGREVYDYRMANSQDHGQDFLTVDLWGMHHQLHSEWLSDDQVPVVCLDGDGAALMHLGAIPIIGSRAPQNFSIFAK